MIACYSTVKNSWQSKKADDHRELGMAEITSEGISSICGIRFKWGNSFISLREHEKANEKSVYGKVRKQKCDDIISWRENVATLCV